MKPDWEDAPEWANWVTMDADGAWYWFETKPSICSDEGIWVQNIGEVEKCFNIKAWTETLEQRPEQ